MGRVIETLNLGTRSPSTATSYTCLLASSSQLGSHVLPAHRSQEGSLPVVSKTSELSWEGGCGNSMSYYPVPEAFILEREREREEEYRDCAVLQRKFRKRFSISFKLKKCFLV